MEAAKAKPATKGDVEIIQSQIDTLGLMVSEVQQRFKFRIALERKLLELKEWWNGFTGRITREIRKVVEYISAPWHERRFMRRNVLRFFFFIHLERVQDRPGRFEAIFKIEPNFLGRAFGYKRFRQGYQRIQYFGDGRKWLCVPNVVRESPAPMIRWLDKIYERNQHIMQTTSMDIR
jgi:hypothetical protein